MLAQSSQTISASCYGYARVSTVMQATDGESLDVQQRTIAGYAQMHGLAVRQTFVERGVSGSKPLGDRPEGRALLDALRPGDVVIAPKLDRMFRSAIDALDTLQRFKARGVTLHLIDLGGDVTSNGGNAVSKLVFTILSAVAEAERDRTRERVAEVKADQRKRGRYLGGRPPFGYRVGEAGELVEHPEEQAAIGRMVAWRKQGMSLWAISLELSLECHKLSHVGVRAVLQRQEI